MDLTRGVEFVLKSIPCNLSYLTPQLPISVFIYSFRTGGSQRSLSVIFLHTGHTHITVLPSLLT